MKILHTIAKVLSLLLVIYFNLWNIWGIFAPFWVDMYEQPPKEVEKFQNYVTERLIDIVDNRLGPTQLSEKQASDMKKLNETLKDFDLASRDLLHVGRSTYSGNPAELRVYQIRNKYQFGLLHLKFQDHNNQTFLVHIEFFPSKGDIREARQLLIHRFTWKHAAFWLAILLTFGLTLYCIYLMVKARLTMHAGWILLLLVNVVKFNLEWSTGDFSFSIITINLPAYGFSQSGAEPWLLRFSIPLGAILFLRKYKNFSTANHQRDAENGS